MDPLIDRIIKGDIKRLSFSLIDAYKFGLVLPMPLNVVLPEIQKGATNLQDAINDNNEIEQTRHPLNILNFAFNGLIGIDVANATKEKTKPNSDPSKN